MGNELRNGRTVIEVAFALRVLALFAGNVSYAARALTEDGDRVSPRTLGRWRDTHWELYWEVRRQVEADATQRTVASALAVCETRLETLKRGYAALGAMQ